MTVEADKISMKLGKNDTKTSVQSHKQQDFKKQEEKIHWVSMGHETQFNNKFGAKLSLFCPFFS